MEPYDWEEETEAVGDRFWHLIDSNFPRIGVGEETESLPKAVLIWTGLTLVGLVALPFAAMCWLMNWLLKQSAKRDHWFWRMFSS